MCRSFAKAIAAAALIALPALFLACAADPLPLPTSPDDPVSPAAPEAALAPPPSVLSSSSGSAAPAAPPPATNAPVHHHHHHSHGPSGSPK